MWLPKLSKRPTEPGVFTSLGAGCKHNGSRNLCGRTTRLTQSINDFLLPIVQGVRSIIAIREVHVKSFSYSNSAIISRSPESLADGPE